ncbi:LytTR family transcriptional regulator [Rhodobacteraceae bacterium D3-12]|nr:LytTR family transcriptional regulator [Rhodobacteraceae bacterium D3-12]
MSDTDRHSKHRERPALHLPEQAAGFAITVAFLTVLGPFGTSDLPALMRAAYWSLSIGLGWALILGLIVGLRRMPYFATRPPILRPLTAIGLAFLPIVAIAIQVDRLFHPDDTGVPLLLMLLNVGALFVLICGVLLARIRPRLEPPAPLPARNAFLDRLPPTLGTALISLTSQDHYVEVTTAKGRELIHMRLADALEELADYPGRQIHRSHWISAHAFTGTSRDNGRLVAHLLDGRTLPVSRSFAADVRRMAPVRPVHPVPDIPT